LHLLLGRYIRGSVRGVRKRDRIVDDTGLRFHYFQEGKVLVVRVLDALSLQGQLLADLLKVGGSRIEFLDRPLQALEAQNEGRDVVKGSARSCSSDYDLNAIGRGLVLVVLAHAAILALFPRVRCGISCCSSLLVVVSLAALVGSFAAAHLEREVNLFGYSVPDSVDAVSVREALENAIAANHDEVEVVLHFEAFDVGVADDDVGVAAEAWAFGLNVSEGLGYRETTRKYSQRSLDVEILLSGA